jgi:hypothetical protein
MVQERVLECSFFIPIRRDENLSDGQPHARSSWRWLYDQLYLRFEGGTSAPGYYQGFYRDADTGQRVDDKSRKFVVAVPEDNIDELRLMLSEACTVFHQKCIYLSVAGRVEFIEAPDNDSG